MRLSDKFDEALAAVEAGGAFVPFIGGEAEEIELRAIAATRCFRLPDRAAIEPYDVAARIEVPVDDRHEQFALLPESIRAQMLGRGSEQWSAGTLQGEAGPLIIANPNHAPTRRKVTLSEELAHLVIGHPPSTLDPATGMRTYDGSIEEEAFGVGGALVMPYSQLFAMVKKGRPLPEIADAFGVSGKLANYRINRVGLRRTYNRRRRGL
jgi:Zn-dependent peptidase ImmA (M78 family)